MSGYLSINCVPPEIFLHIFDYLSVKQLMKCRAVSCRWKEIIDEMTRSDVFWKKHCIADYSGMYKDARKKCRISMSWCSIYRSLSLWGRLNEASENRDEFCSAADVQDEIRNCIILRDGVIGVHKRSAIVYYDIETLRPLDRVPISGNYLKYSESDEILAILSYQLQLFIHWKLKTNKHVTFENVKTFLFLDHAIYNVSLNDDVYICRLDTEEIKNEFLVHSNDSIVAMGYCNDRLQLLTFKRTIYTVVDSKLLFATSLGPTSNLLHQLHQYNFLELLDWRIYFQWMFLLNHSIPPGPLQDIVTTRMYGDVVFVGSNLGVLRIYYKPYTGDEFNIFRAEPLKQYNFMERSDCPVLSMCPILNVDVQEVENGHTVIVVMPKKLAVLNFTHNRRQARNPPQPSCSKMESVKIITID